MEHSLVSVDNVEDKMKEHENRAFCRKTNLWYFTFLCHKIRIRKFFAIYTNTIEIVWYPNFQQ